MSGPEPRQQKEAQHLAATFGGHAWLGLGIWGVIAIALDVWTAAWMTPLIYLAVWEGVQWIQADQRTCPLFFHCVLDALGVAFACYAAAFVQSGQQMEAMACWGASVGVMATGWRVRA